jgi:RNA polymerase sigma factor (sigma-70 family)
MEAASMSRDRFVLTRGSLEKLLDCLDADRERAAGRYETLRAGLIRFFEWRGCTLADAHADEAIDRVARRVEEGEAIRNVPAYAAGVARFLFLEMVKERKREEEARRRMPAVEEPAADEEGMECVRRCLEALPPESAQLLIAYYEDGPGGKIETRRRLAEGLGTSATGLRMRLLRLRTKLEECAAECLGKRRA